MEGELLMPKYVLDQFARDSLGRMISMIEVK
jgi:hypothetical protein